MTETKINFFNKLKNTVVNKFSAVPDITGQTLEDFHVDRRMEIPSGEADIYLCTGTGIHAGRKFILKYYRRENAVKPEIIAKLQSISSPYVAPVSGFGEYRGYQYTVRPYYEMPALSDVLTAGTRFSEDELRTFIIPSVIEGLKAVHDIDILHRDLKPGNLIPDDNGEHVVLIDFGISSNADGMTFVMTQPGMTPFYAAPEAIQGIFHRETDYYALGITVFELFTGYTPFQNPGISGEDAARLAAISKIEFPDDFPENLRKLVLGLTYKDISHRNEKDNPNRRWGYDEVKRWLNGEDVPVPGEITGTVNTEPAFQPYRFNGQTYTSEKELLLVMLRQPENAIKDLGRGILTHHYYILDEKKGTLCNSAESKISKNNPENIRHLSALIYSLRPDISEIMFNGRMLNGLQEVGKAIIDAVINEAVETGNLQSNNSELINPVKQFVSSGIPEDYASLVLNSTEHARIFENVRKLWSYEDKNIYTDTELALVLGYSICNDRRIPVHGKVYDSPEAFFQEMKHLAEKDRRAYTEFTQKAKADLNFLEKKLPDTESRKIIVEALSDSKLAVFGDNEYIFKSGQDFDNFIYKLVQEEKPYELQSLFNRYKTPLTDVSRKVWNTDSLTKLKQTVSGFIRIGEHLFTGEEACKKFLNEVRERGQKEPEYLLGFIKTHKDALDTAVKSFPRINNAVTDLYSNGNELVLFGEHIFHNSAEFATFIEAIITKGCNAPDYLVRFTDFHHQEIQDLRSKNTICQVALTKLMSIRNRIVSFDEYIFPTVDEFRSFMDTVLQRGQQDPSYLKRFINIHEKTLTVLNGVNTLSSIVKPVLDAGNEVIELDEYTFSNASDFNDFVSELSSKDLNKTPRLSNFAKKHHDSLIRLENNASIADQVKTILRAENVIEKEKAISINGIIFNPFTIPVTIEKGDIIKFGDYPQDSYGGESPIEWLVLDVKNNEAFLISRYGLDCKQYNHEFTNITWENCDLRKWLNNDFIKSAFSEQEAKRIKVSDLKNNNSSYGISGNDTKDRIFCLSVTEAEQYFTNDSDRICKPTDYALKNGAYRRDNGCFWWLRTIGMGAYEGRECGKIVKRPPQATFVYPEGYIGRGMASSIPVVRNDTVRPALRIII